MVNKKQSINCEKAAKEVFSEDNSTGVQSTLYFNTINKKINLIKSDKYSRSGNFI